MQLDDTTTTKSEVEISRQDRSEISLAAQDTNIGREMNLLLNLEKKTGDIQLRESSKERRQKKKEKSTHHSRKDRKDSERI
jgi:hypothetical protein